MEQFASMLPLVLVFALMYFLIIRPQSKKAKEHQLMLDALNRGDRILLNGGIIGTITNLHEKEVSLEIASGVVVSAARSMIAAKMNADGEKAKAPAPKTIEKAAAKPKKAITKKK